MKLRATQQKQQLDDIPRAADWYRGLLTGSQVCLLASGAVTISGVEIASTTMAELTKEETPAKSPNSVVSMYEDSKHHPSLS
jgi:hypothetical protein